MNDLGKQESTFGQIAETNAPKLAQHATTWLRSINDTRTIAQIRVDFFNKIGASNAKMSHLMPENMDRAFFQSLGVTDQDPISWPNWMAVLLEQVNQTPLDQIASGVLACLNNGIVFFGVEENIGNISMFPTTGSIEFDNREGIGLFFSVPMNFQSGQIPELFFYEAADALFRLYRMSMVISNPPPGEIGKKIRYPKVNEYVTVRHYGSLISLGMFPGS